MDELNFGTAGVPGSAAKTTPESGIERIPELGLDSMELEFVYGVRMKDDRAVLVGELAKEKGVKLTVCDINPDATNRCVTMTGEAIGVVQIIATLNNLLDLCIISSFYSFSIKDIK